MKSLFVALVLTTASLQAYAFGDQVECKVTNCDQSHSTSNYCAYVTNWNFKIGTDVAVSFSIPDGSRVGFQVHGTSTQTTEGLMVELASESERVLALIPLTCQKGQFNESCLVNADADGRVAVSENPDGVTNFVVRCASVN